jgi:hypothetical protein
MKRFAVLLSVVIAAATTLLFSFSFTRPVHLKISTPRFSIPYQQLRSGDIIFRDGRGAVSSLFRNFSKTDPRYSHAGIIHREDNQAYVYHVIGGEGNEGLMRKEKLADFCSNLQAYSFAVYRTDLDGKIIDSVAGNFFRNHLSFDAHFDLNSDDKMYCTELVYKILRQVSSDNNFLPLTTIAGVVYCACDNIYTSPHLTNIYSHAYDQ